jgi:hypothetical protein
VDVPTGCARRRWIKLPRSGFFRLPIQADACWRGLTQGVGRHIIFPVAGTKGRAMFKMLGVLLVLYTLYAGVKGVVYAKSGAWGKTVSRTESPRYFWVVIAIYGFLALALLTIF